ncbi:MAG: RecBCD enzyme subunit RecD [Syntrophaceae bacterium PtaB.Bin038]|nr:MAG: RecBCD enzyme subunit RecD [Syntrophaceae bacterium PtaB.Bin038]
MNPWIVEHLHAAGVLSNLDRGFARLMVRLAGEADGDLGLAAALVSRASAEGNICLDLAGIAGRPVSPGDGAPRCPLLAPWVSALRRTAVVGAPGDRRPLVLDGSRLYLYRHWDAEQGLGRFLRERSRDDAPAVDTARLREGIEKLFPDRDGETDWQRVAAAVAVLRPLSVITGGPGTGKTTTVARVLALLLEQSKARPLRLALAAPTGKAAARLQEAIWESAGRLACADGIRETLAGMEASTLHRLLGRRPGFSAFGRGEEEPLPFDAVVVDEASMVSLHLLFALARSLSRDARLILLGDRDQLASVEAGAVLGDICGSGRKRLYSVPAGKRIAEASGEAVPLLPGGTAPSLGDCIVELRRNWRFGAESGIGELSRAIREGEPGEALSILLEGRRGDLGFRAVPAPRDLSRALVDVVLEGYGDYMEGSGPAEVFERFNRFRILCALREGPYSVDALNAAVQAILARAGRLRPGHPWYEGRPVMVTRNDYGLRLFNGDVGIALADPDAGGALRVFFPGPDGSMRTFEPYRLPEHETVFAMTVHKSQGTEFDRVLFILPEVDARVLTRELLYTGVTRARKRADLWAGEEILAAALSRRIERVSGLRDMLWPA